MFGIRWDTSPKVTTRGFNGIQPTKVFGVPVNPGKSQRAQGQTFGLGLAAVEPLLRAVEKTLPLARGRALSLTRLVELPHDVTTGDRAYAPIPVVLVHKVRTKFL